MGPAPRSGRGRTGTGLECGTEWRRHRPRQWRTRWRRQRARRSPGRSGAGSGRTGAGRAAGSHGSRQGGKGRASANRTGGRSDRPEGPARRRRPQGLGGDQVEGRQAVRELLRANRRPGHVGAHGRGHGRGRHPRRDRGAGRPPAGSSRATFARRIDAVARTDAPQGVVALARPVEETPLETLCRPSSRGRLPFLLVLDGITDPHNLGALLRSAECAGVTGVVLPRHRSAHLSPTVAKVAAGAIEYLPMALVAGVPTALASLSGLGVWTVGLVGDARQSLYELALGDQPVALVLGSEGTGLAALTRKRCDDAGRHPPARYRSRPSTCPRPGPSPASMWPASGP